LTAEPALPAALWSLADQGRTEAALRLGLALLRTRPQDRLLLGLLARLARGQDEAPLLQALAAGDADAAALLAPPGDAAPTLRAKLATWLLDLGRPEAALALCARPWDAALQLAAARVLRALGRLPEAAEAYRGLDDLEARRLLPALSGEPPGAPAAADLAAVPFLRLRQPLPEAEHRALREVLLARLPGFRPARVRAVAEAPGSRDERRSAQVLMRLPPAIEPLRRLLWQRQAAALGALLGTTVEGGGLELQATLSGEGDHYAAHRDSGDSATAGRLLTLVYYLHRQPRAFRGGALRLYDSDLQSGHWLGGGYTSLEPEDGTLLLFPAAAWHEIEPVTDCADPADGRLTVNGWFRTAPPR
jgi:hypothetical protein